MINYLSATLIKLKYKKIKKKEKNQKFTIVRS